MKVVKMAFLEGMHIKTKVLTKAEHKNPITSNWNGSFTGVIANKDWLSAVINESSHDVVWWFCEQLHA